MDGDERFEIRRFYDRRMVRWEIQPEACRLPVMKQSHSPKVRPPLGLMYTAEIGVLPVTSVKKRLGVPIRLA